jgi:Chaperone of endosialidase
MGTTTISLPRWAAVVSLLLALLALLQSPASAQQASTTPAAQPEASTAATTAPASQASVPRLIKFSGVLRDLAGKPLTGPVDVSFALYQNQAGGEPLWFETQTVQADSLGNYTVLLGAMHETGVPIELFTSGEAHWLGVQVGNLPEQPRVLLLSVPYALKAGDAETLGGKPASAFMLAPESGSGSSSSGTKTGSTTGTTGTNTTNSTTALTTGTAALATITGTQNYIPVFTANDGSMGNSVMYQSSGKVGIGTQTPVTQFDVADSAGTSAFRGFMTSEYSTNASAAQIIGRKSRGTESSPTAVANGDYGAAFLTDLYDGAGYQQPAFMTFKVHGTVATGYVPTDFVVYTGWATASRTERFRVTSTGNIGIGTSSPAAKLDVAGAIRQGGVAGMDGYLHTNSTNLASTTALNPGILVYGGDTGQAAYGEDVGYNAGTGRYRNRMFFYGTAADMAFARTNATPPTAQSDFTDLMVIRGDSGNVGIGTAAPAYALDVAGDIRASGTFRGDGSGLTGVPSSAFGTVTSVATGVGLTGGPITSTGTISLNLTYTDGRYATLGANTFTGTQTLPANGLVVGANQLAASGGNVGVGTTSPGATLDVEGPAAPATVSTGNGASGESGLQVVAQSGGDSTFYGCCSGGFGGAGGVVSLTAGTGGAGGNVGGVGGGVSLTAGAGGSGSTSGGNGGSISLTAGTAGASGGGTDGYGGSISISGGSGSTGGGGAVTVSAGSGGGVGGSGGSMYLLPGAGTRGSPSGFVGIGTSTENGANILVVNGSAIATAWNTTSSRRFKTNIHTLQNGLGLVARLRGVTYNEKSGGKPQIGVIAEEVAKVLPQVVAFDRKGRPLGVDYSRLTAVLIQATKQQQQEIAQQHAELWKEKQEIEKLARAKDKKDAQLARLAAQNRKLASEVEQLDSRVRGNDDFVKALEARLNRDEAQQKATRVKLARVARRQKKQSKEELARVQF